MPTRPRHQTRGYDCERSKDKHLIAVRRAKEHEDDTNNLNPKIDLRKEGFHVQRGKDDLAGWIQLAICRKLKYAP